MGGILVNDFLSQKNRRLLVNKNLALRRENGIYLDVFFPPPKEISVLLFHYWQS